MHRDRRASRSTSLSSAPCYVCSYRSVPIHRAGEPVAPPPRPDAAIAVDNLLS